MSIGDDDGAPGLGSFFPLGFKMHVANPYGEAWLICKLLRCCWCTSWLWQEEKTRWCQKYVSLCQKFMGREEEFAPKNVHVNISKNDLYQKSTLNSLMFMLSIEYKVGRFSHFSSQIKTSINPHQTCQGVRYSDLMGPGQKIENIFVQLLSEISWIFGLFTFFFLKTLPFETPEFIFKALSYALVWLEALHSDARLLSLYNCST